MSLHPRSYTYPRDQSSFEGTLHQQLALKHTYMYVLYTDCLVNEYLNVPVSTVSSISIAL